MLSTRRGDSARPGDPISQPHHLRGPTSRAPRKLPRFLRAQNWEPSPPGISCSLPTSWECHPPDPGRKAGRTWPVPANDARPAHNQEDKTGSGDMATCVKGRSGLTLCPHTAPPGFNGPVPPQKVDWADPDPACRPRIPGSEPPESRGLPRVCAESSLSGARGPDAHLHVGPVVIW